MIGVEVGVDCLDEPQIKFVQKLDIAINLRRCRTADERSWSAPNRLGFSRPHRAERGGDPSCGSLTNSGNSSSNLCRIFSRISWTP